MSSAERFVRHHKQQTDRAIGEAYTRLAIDPNAVVAFDELLNEVRRRAPRVLDGSIVGGRHPGVDALVNLARFRRDHVRPLSLWPATAASWRPALCGLAQHLVGRYPVPGFLAAAWYATDDYAEDKRRWYVAHGSGSCFHSLALPIAMTKKMEGVFLSSPPHLSIEHAMRRAELIALGGSEALVRAVLETRVAGDLRHGDFWRTVWRFLVANADDIKCEQVGPLIDFLQAIRHDRVAVDMPHGLVMREPPRPAFSMKGRTAHSMLRIMHEWHRSLGLTSAALEWPPSSLRPMLIEEPASDPAAPGRTWQLVELTNAAQLRAEGAALHHCVASYAARCWSGSSRIWSLRTQRGGNIRHVLTIEVDMKKRAIVQARGWGNRSPSGKPRRLLREWAIRERLRV